MNAFNLFMAMLGSLLLGFMLGWKTYQTLQGLANRRIEVGKCSRCGSEGFTIPCERCHKRVARCHSGTVLKTDDPALKPRLRPRRSLTICTECMTTNEVEIMV